MQVNKLARRIFEKTTGRPMVRLLTVRRATHLTPNMIRITLTGDNLTNFPEDREGGNCKLLLPEDGESRDAFQARLNDGPAPVRRTYTVRHFRKDSLELDIDFVAHGDSGPACRWAQRAAGNSVEEAFLGFMGPSAPKLATFEADWYLVAADLSAVPVAAAALEAMPRDAQGLAVFEIPSPADQQDIDAPAGVDMHWLVQPAPHVPSTLQLDFLNSVDLPTGRIQTCIAGESGVIRQLKQQLNARIALKKSDAYISGYWKMGLIEDEHQKHKRKQG